MAATTVHSTAGESPTYGAALQWMRVTSDNVLLWMGMCGKMLSYTWLHHD